MALLIVVIHVTFNHPVLKLPPNLLARTATPPAGKREDPKCPEESKQHSRCNRDRKHLRHLLLSATLTCV